MKWERCKLRCLIFLTFQNRGMSKAILLFRTWYTDIVFPWGDRAVKFRFSHLGPSVSLSLTSDVFEMLFFDWRKIVYIPHGNFSPYRLWPARGHRAAAWHLLPTLVQNSSRSLQGGQAWKANSPVPGMATFWVLTVYHIFWFLFLFSLQEKTSHRKRIYFIFISCEKTNQRTLK